MSFRRSGEGSFGIRWKFKIVRRWGRGSNWDPQVPPFWRCEPGWQPTGWSRRQQPMCSLASALALGQCRHEHLGAPDMGHWLENAPTPRDLKHPKFLSGSHRSTHIASDLVLACWLSQNNQNKVITILFFAQCFCRNKSSPIRTSHNNAFVARFFLSLAFAICLLPQFFTSMLPFFRSFVKVAVTVSQRDAFFPRVLPKTAVLRTVFYCFCSLGATWKWFSSFFRRKERIQRECLPAMFPEKPSRKDIVKT